MKTTTQKTAQEKINSLPKGMKAVALTAQRCIGALVKNGYSFQDAENVVLEALKEMETDLKSGNYSMVNATLRMAFLDIPVEQAAKQVIKSILK